MSLSSRFFCSVALVSLVFSIQSSAYADTNCPAGYKPQANPFSRWAGCDIADYGQEGGTTNSVTGEWSASFYFIDFITIKGNAYCLQEQYPMPSQKICDEPTFPVVDDVDITKTGSTCWCKVTAWQPFTVRSDAPFQEIETKYIQIPVDGNKPCTLEVCSDTCASIGFSTSFVIGLSYHNSGLRGSIYNSVKQCVPDENYVPTDCSNGYEYSATTSQCEAVEYAISYVLDGGTNNNSNPSSYTIESPTITLSNPTRSGFDFAGWYTTSGFDSNSKITQIATGTTGAKTLYAKWVEIVPEAPVDTYTLTWIGYDGTGVMQYTSLHAGDTMSCRKVLGGEPDGYVLNGCDCNNGIGYKALGTTFTMPAANVICQYQYSTSVSESECEPGYYLSQNSDDCVICDENHYCTGGEDSIMQSCPTGLVSPVGAVSADDCGKIMFVDDNVLYLTQKQQTTPALAVKINGKVYYAKTTPVSQIEQQPDVNTKHFLRTEIDGVEYSIHDNTI